MPILLPGPVKPVRPYLQMRQPLRTVSGVPQVPGIAPSSPGMGLPSDPAQQAWGIINPQLQAAADAINRRSSLGSQAISGLTNVFAQRFGAAENMNVFGPEKAPLRAAAEWGQSNLVGSGQQQGANLAAALAQAGPGIKGPGDVNLVQEGKGAGGAAYGTGISWLDAQVAKAAAAQTRAALAPSYAAGLGQMQQGTLAAQLARQLADQQGQIEASIPELMMNLTQRQQDVEFRNRQLAESTREFNVEQAGRRGQITGPQAPTLGGRQAYWDKVAADRTASTGVQYVGTTTGIRPLTDPRTKRPVLTAEGRKQRIAEIYTTEVNPDGTLTARGQQQMRALGGSGAGVEPSLTKAGISAATTLEKEQTRHQEQMAGLQIKLKNAQTSATKAQISQQVADERAKHNRWIEQHSGVEPMGTPTGNRPRRNKAGVWTTATGSVLKPAGQRYWQDRYNRGLTDGRGGLGAANKKKGGGMPGVIKKKATTP